MRTGPARGTSQRRISSIDPADIAVHPAVGAGAPDPALPLSAGAPDA